MRAVITNTLKEINLDSLPAKLINAQSDSGSTALHYAAELGHIEIVKKLIKVGADLNIKNKQGSRAFDLAGKAIQKLLLDAGAKDRAGYNKLMRAVVQESSKEVADLIWGGFNLDDVTDDGQTALTLAAYNRHFKIMEMLLDTGTKANIGEALDTLINTEKPYITPEVIHWAGILIDKYGAKFKCCTELMYYIWKGDVEAAAKLIKVPGINLNADAFGMTAVHMAIKMGKPEIVNLLIEAGADINQGQPLIRATRNGDIESVNLLLNGGVKININEVSTTPLQIAVLQGHANIADILIKAKVDVSAKNAAYGNTALHCCFFGDPAKKQGSIDGLLKAGIDVNAQNLHGKTALHIAIEAGDYESAAKLIPLTNLALIDNSGHNPLTVAIAGSNADDFLPLFLSAGVNANVKDDFGNTALHWACSLGNEAAVAALIHHGVDLEIQNNSELTALEIIYHRFVAYQNDIAAQAPNTENKARLIVIYQRLMTKLLDEGARDLSGRTPIMRAIEHMEEKEAYSVIHEWINKKKADVNAIDNMGHTAAMQAVKKGRVSILELLIQSGTDLLYFDENGCTALSSALIPEKSEFFNLIVPFLDPSLSKMLRTALASSKLSEGKAFVQELRSKLPPSDLCKTWALPLLLPSKPLAVLMMQNFTADEREQGFEFLRKNYPKVDLNRFIELNIQFNQTHFRIIEEALPTSRRKVDLELLLSMFDKINIRYPRRPGYLNPERLKDDGAPRTLAQLRETLQLMVRRVKEKKKPLQLHLKRALLNCRNITQSWRAF